MPGFRGLISKAVSALQGVIGRARSEGASTYDIYQTVQQDVPDASIQQIGHIVSAQDEIASAIDAVNTASASDAVTADMIAVPVWATPGTTAGGGGPYKVRIPYTNPGEAEGTISGWVTDTMQMLPAGVGGWLG